MRATGIIRRVDDLGRIVIPKDIRQRLGIRDGDPMELFVEGGSVIYKKYRAEDNTTQLLADAVEWIKNDDCLTDDTKIRVIEKLKAAQTALLFKEGGENADY